MTQNKDTHSASEKILIITNKSKFSDSLTESMNDAGYIASQENTGEKGVKMIYDILPQLIIVDIDLPDMDGYAVLEKISAETMLSKIPVFLMSVNGQAINMRKVPHNSVSEYITSMHADVDQILQRTNTFFGKVMKNAGKNGKRILWVEDDKLIGTILSKKLIASGFDLTHVKSGDEAVSILSADTKFDAILLDLILPGMSGFDILTKLKATEHTKNIPVMILSNLSKPGDIERAKILGAKKYVIKAATSLDKIVEDTKALCN